jgi:hypothetical protein
VIKQQVFCIGVLAAASPFFAALLPDSELELDVCISIDWSFEDVFCILEYIYSGKLLCSVQSKDRILGILKEFGVFVPGHLQSSGPSGRIEDNEPEVEIIIEEANASHKTSEDNGKTHSDNSLTASSDHLHVFVSKELISKESIIPVTNQNAFRQEENVHEKFVSTLKIYSNKSKAQTSMKTPIVNTDSLGSETCGETVKVAELHSHLKNSIISKVICQSSSLEEPPSGYMPSDIEAITIKNHPTPNRFDIYEVVAEDDWTVQQVPDRQTVTLQFPKLSPDSTNSHPKELEHNLIKSTVTHCNASTYPLPLYHSHTWCYGVYTPFDPDVTSLEMGQYDDPLSINKGQPFIHDWTSFKQPTFLVSRPQRVYSRREIVRQTSNNNKGVLKLNDIQNMKAHKGKIHVTLNGKPLVQPMLPQLFHGGSDFENGQSSELNQSRINRRPNNVPNITESDNDKIDLALAKHFLQEEVRIKQKLHMRIRMFSERLTQYLYF